MDELKLGPWYDQNFVRYKSILSVLFHQITLLDIQNLENRVIIQFELFLSCLSSNVFFKICVMRIKIKYFYVLRINFWNFLVIKNDLWNIYIHFYYFSTFFPLNRVFHYLFKLLLFFFIVYFYENTHYKE